MWFRRRRWSEDIDRMDIEPVPDGTAELMAPEDDAAATGLPAVRAERALLALAVHAEQLDGRLARIEARMDAADAEAAATAEAQALENATHDELLEVRLHSARVAAELSRVSVELQGRIDDLAVQIPPAVDEDRHQQRARVFAETILDLSDRLHTGDVDLRDTREIDLRDDPGRAAS
jgi:hypothetical protein